MTIAILGAGPAGLFAAHAVAQKTDDFVIFSNKVERTVQRGAQYLHKPIPGLTEDIPDGRVLYVHWGMSFHYSLRVYNENEPEVSWGRFEDGYHPTWNLRKAYSRAWSMYQHRIKGPVDLGWRDIESLEGYHNVISSIPLSAFCSTHPDNYGFESQTVQIVSDKLHYPYEGVDTIIYNGRPKSEQPEWYRLSNLYGWTAQEYPDTSVLRPDAVRVVKPLRYRHSPVPRHWLLVGRYGAWAKRALTHDAYYNVKNAMVGF